MAKFRKTQKILTYELDAQVDFIKQLNDVHTLIYFYKKPVYKKLELQRVTLRTSVKFKNLSHVQSFLGEPFDRTCTRWHTPCPL